MTDLSSRIQSHPVSLAVGTVTLLGDLSVVSGSKGLVIFAHGTGSGRLSPRNRAVAEVLQQHGMSTLLIDLLTPEEEKADEQTRELRFNISLLSQRLVHIYEWAKAEPSLKNLKIGYFGSSTGGAAALIAAAGQADSVAVVVSRGGRVDLAKQVLPKVKAPVLLIVGERDTLVLLWNEEALELLNDESRLEIIPNATHLFEEPGALGHVARSAAAWFARHF